MDRRRNFMKDKGGPAYIKSRAAFVSVSNAVISVIYCFWQMLFGKEAADEDRDRGER